VIDRELALGATAREARLPSCDLPASHDSDVIEI
jgi:hypothetical protein